MKNMVFYSLLAGMAAGIGGVGAAEAQQVFAWKGGGVEVWSLQENQGPGNPSILINAADAVKKYIPTGKSLSATNEFLIKSGGKIILVDTGFGGALFGELASLGVKPGDVDLVLLTHTHIDHVSGLARDGKALFPKAELLLAKAEYDWAKTNPKTMESLKPYESRTRTFDPGTLGGAGPEAAPGVKAWAAYGHTPGHTVFLVESGGQRLLIIGDLLHVEAVQFPRPDISASYDKDPAEAAKTREAVLAWAAANKAPIAGSHLLYPAMGDVAKDGAGFKYTPKK
jgi:glyoxylase-like metal-dependent hydrolase (beta-lactamase superfamily II)